MVKGEKESSGQASAARIYEWFNKRGVHSAFSPDPKNPRRYSRIEFGSLTSDPPSLTVRTMEHGHTVAMSEPAPEEGRSFLEVVQATLPDAPILGELRFALSNLGDQRNLRRA